MNKLSIALSILFMLALIVIMAPSIMAMNRGKILRNIAIWLAIFAALGLFYQNFGPGRAAHLSFSSRAEPDETPPPGAIKDTGDKGFTPPRE